MLEFLSLAILSSFFKCNILAKLGKKEMKCCENGRWLCEHLSGEQDQIKTPRLQLVAKEF